jgi:DNA-binding transcriptional regulator YhcF (GntR family)
MNLADLSAQLSQRQSETSENDLQKLVDICNSYGLDVEETNQLISEFKRGALYKSDQSFNSSLNETLS